LCIFELLTLLLHLLLLLLFCLKHTLKSICWVISWSIRHRVLSDCFIFNNWWNNALSSQSFDDVISGRHLRHRFLFVNKYHSWNFCLFTWIELFQNVIYCHSKLEWSQISLNIHFSDPILFEFIIFQTWIKFKIWPFFFPQPIFMSN